MRLKVDKAAYNNFAWWTVEKSSAEPAVNRNRSRKKGTEPNRPYQKREKPNRMFAVLGGVTKQLAV
jgi:hypothetical protein